MNEFKFFQKRQQLVEGEINPNHEPGVIGSRSYLWRWCNSNEGVPTYSPDTFELTMREYNVITTTWSQFMILTQDSRLVFIRYIITPKPNNRLIEDLLPHQWDIDLDNDELVIKCAIW